MSWLDLTGVSELNIKASGCQGIAMLLAANHGLASDSAYEIIIGDSTASTPNMIKVSDLNLAINWSISWIIFIIHSFVKLLTFTRETFNDR